MYCGTNKKALCSQEQIADALIRLLREEPYESIRISAICQEAEVSRQTFYTLFASKENIILYELGRKHRFTPGQTCRCEGAGLTLRGLCREYSEYIIEKREFLSLLARNHIFYFVSSGLSKAFLECTHFLPGVPDPKRTFAARFTAGGLSGAALTYIEAAEPMSQETLEETFFSLFSGHFLTGEEEHAPQEAADGQE